MKRLFIYIFLLGAVLTGCFQDRTVDTEFEEPEEMPDQEMWDFEIRATKMGELQAIIRAGHMRRYSKNATSLFDEGIHIDFYNEDEKVTSVLKAETGELEEQTTNVTARGNVVVESDSGITLYTEELYYDKNKEKIFSETDVKIATQKGDTLHGVGFESDTQMDEWEIKKPYDGVSHTSVDLDLESNEPDSAAMDTVVTDTSRLDSAAVDTLP